MHKPIKYAEKGLTYAAKGAWVAFEALNRINPNPAFTPKWSELPLQKSWQKVKPPLGWPRETDSLCPNCFREARQSSPSQMGLPTACRRCTDCGSAQSWSGTSPI